MPMTPPVLTLRYRSCRRCPHRSRPPAGACATRSRRAGATRSRRAGATRSRRAGATRSRPARASPALRILRYRSRRVSRRSARRARRAARWSGSAGTSAHRVRANVGAASAPRRQERDSDRHDAGQGSAVHGAPAERRLGGKRHISVVAGVAELSRRHVERGRLVAMAFAFNYASLEWVWLARGRRSLERIGTIIHECDPAPAGFAAVASAAANNQRASVRQRIVSLSIKNQVRLQSAGRWLAGVRPPVERRRLACRRAALRRGRHRRPGSDIRPECPTLST